MNCYKLHINLEKSCYMHFKKYIPISSRVDSLSNDMMYNIHINNSELKKVTHTKFLGVIIDENLTWDGGGGGGGANTKVPDMYGVGGVFGTQNTKVTCTLLYNKGGVSIFYPESQKYKWYFCTHIS